VEVVTVSAFPSADGERHQPQDGEDYGDDPQQVNSEADTEEDQYQ
jgi:hypothetical protein